MLSISLKHFFLIEIIFVLIILVKSSQYENQNIDTLAQKYLDAERNLWHLVRSTNLYDNDNTLIHIYETHEEFLGKYFSETGIFDRLLSEPRIQYLDENRLMERHAWKIVDSIKYINITALNCYRFLNHRQYDHLPNLLEDIFDGMPKMISTLRRHGNYDFWTFVKNVNQKGK